MMRRRALVTLPLLAVGVVTLWLGIWGGLVRLLGRSRGGRRNWSPSTGRSSCLASLVF